MCRKLVKFLTIIAGLFILYTLIRLTVTPRRNSRSRLYLSLLVFGFFSSAMQRCNQLAIAAIWTLGNEIYRVNQNATLIFCELNEVKLQNFGEKNTYFIKYNSCIFVKPNYYFIFLKWIIRFYMPKNIEKFILLNIYSKKIYFTYCNDKSF